MMTNSRFTHCLASQANQYGVLALPSLVIEQCGRFPCLTVKPGYIWGGQSGVRNGLEGVDKNHPILCPAWIGEISTESSLAGIGVESFLPHEGEIILKQKQKKHDFLSQPFRILRSAHRALFDQSLDRLQFLNREIPV
jgi:hypothetical protein